DVAQLETVDKYGNAAAEGNGLGPGAAGLERSDSELAQTAQGASRVAAQSDIVAVANGGGNVGGGICLVAPAFKLVLMAGGQPGHGESHRVRGLDTSVI